MTDGADRFIVEFQQIGNSVKVTAFDPVTLTEASIVGAPSVGQEQLGQLAVRKLLYVMKKEN